MRFLIDNLALVRHADIRVEGISLIASPNGSGKSTISRGLATFASLGQRMPRLVQTWRFRKILQSVEEALKKNGIQFLFMSDPTEFPLEWYHELFTRDFWMSCELFKKWLQVNFLGSAKQRARMGAVFPSDYFTKDEFAGRFSEVAGVVLKVVSLTDAQVASDVAMLAMDSAFHGDWSSLSYLNDDTVLSLEDDSTSMSVQINAERHHANGMNLGARFFTSVFYLEPIHALDFAERLDKVSSFVLHDRYMAGAAEPVRLLASTRKIASWPADFPVKKESVLSRIEEIVHGHLEENVETLMYREHLSDGTTRSLKLVNMASGMKPLSALARAIEKGAILPGGLLIIDEPESSLHPAWQVAFSGFLCWLSAQCQIKLLLNTHSPYFLRAIDVASRREHCERNCHYYVMRQCHNDYRRSTECVDGVIDQIYEEMHRPFSLLREEVPVEEEEATHD